MMRELNPRLRVALVAGTLAVGGAEKQLVHVARALLGIGAEVRVYCLTRGEYYESALRALGVEPIWFGSRPQPLVRLAGLVRRLHRFQPHVIQSLHSYTNIYLGVPGRLLGAVTLGVLASSLGHCRQANGRWTRWILRAPDALLVNARSAREEVIRCGLVEPGRLYHWPIAIDLDRFCPPPSLPELEPERVQAIFVGRLAPVKRVDRFLTALSLAGAREPRLHGIIVGDGPERESTMRMAAEKGLGPDRVVFLGQRGDIPQLLGDAQMLVLTSDDEGIPNVIVEAMAMRLPVVSTPAGDAASIVEDGQTGFLVPFDDVAGLADRMVRLARSPDLRRRLGSAGRRCVEQQYSDKALPGLLLNFYRSVAQRRRNRRVIAAIDGLPRASASRLDCHCRSSIS